MGALLSLMGIGSGVSWIVYAVVFGLGVAAGAGPSIWIEEERIDGYEQTAKAATERADLASQDAKRWHDASDLRDAAVIALTGQLNDQSAAVQAGKAREAELRTSLDAARAQNETLQQQADQLSKELDDEQAKAPADVRNVGPIVLRRAPSLFAD